MGELGDHAIADLIWAEVSGEGSLGKLKQHAE